MGKTKLSDKETRDIIHNTSHVMAYALHVTNGNAFNALHACVMAVAAYARIADANEEKLIEWVSETINACGPEEAAMWLKQMHIVQREMEIEAIKHSVHVINVRMPETKTKKKGAKKKS